MGKNKTKKSWALLLVIVMLFSVFQPLGNMAETAEAAAKITFDNVSDDGEDKISLTDERTFEAVVKLSEGTTKKQAEKLAKEVKWSLYRSKGIMDTEWYPYQFKGGALSKWKVFDSKTPFFSYKTTVVKKSGSYALKLTLKNKYMFGADGIDSRPRYVRSTMLDYVGDYKLSAKTAKGKLLGSVTVRVNPYDSYRLNSEFAKELKEAEKYVAGRSDMYAEVRSMGKSTNGYDMPYIIISDSKNSVDNWEGMVDKMEENPQYYIDQVKAGKLDYRIPILYSNVHADENPGADAPMNFIWDLVKSDKTDNKLTYNYITGFTEAGKKQLEKEMKDGQVHWSSLITKLENGPTGVGFIQEGKGRSDVVDLEKWYTMETVSVDVKDLLSKVFFIIVPEENVDARTLNLRHNGNGFDLNRDNMFQTQVETQNMTKMIAHWNPSLFAEFHGFISGFQIEPCSPTHEPNIDWDLFIEHGIAAGEAFGAAAIANNDQFNSFRMPMRDYLTEDGKGNPFWMYPWDDMSSCYTPQYALLHGAISFTIEVPEGNEDGTRALEYGMMSESKYVADNRETIFLNQLEVWNRGVKGIDADSVRPYYVDRYDHEGAEADIFRPRYEENGSFFPEYYVIPVDNKNQQDIDAAYEMQEHLLRNGIKVSKLTKDTVVNDVTYKAGSFVVDMHQAKRNVANNILYDGILILGWDDLYSEPITAFSQSRGFDMDIITKKGAFNGMLTELTAAEKGKTLFEGVEGKYVVVSNNSVDAVRAVNTLLKKGLGVGYITEHGENKGDFVVSFANFQKIKDNFVLQAKGVEELPTARLLEKATVYVGGKQASFHQTKDGKNFGMKDYQDMDNPPYNWDLFAYGEQLGFTLTRDLKKADIIVGNQPLSDAEVKAVKKGKPYLAAGTETLDGVKSILKGFDWSVGHPYWMEDALAHIEYVESSMVTDKYVQENDTIMYGYGGGYITKVPEKAKVLIRVTEEDPLEGFMLKDSLDAYKGSIQAIEYKDGKLDLTVFANTLTNKTHQQDDYRYASNAIYQRVMGKICTAKDLK